MQMESDTPLIEEQVIDRIQYLLKFKHWTPYKLAKEADMSYSNLNNIMNRKSCPSIATLEKICNGFNISLSEFFSFTENPLRDTKLTETHQDIFNSYESLSAKNKELLIAYLRGLCQK